MMSKRRNILILKTPPHFSKEPARPFKNISLGGIARPNIIYVPKFTTQPNLREIEKVMSGTTNAIGETIAKNPNKLQKEKAIPRSTFPKIPTILKGGGKVTTAKAKGPRAKKGRYSQNELTTSTKESIKKKLETTPILKLGGKESKEKNQNGGQKEKTVSEHEEKLKEKNETKKTS